MNPSAVGNDLEPVHYLPDQKESTADKLLRADLHGTTLSLTTSLRLAYDMNCFL